ncbi:hypothetical protein AK812_SmicGene25613 [Symbiodinium microadriaticum]|uniref:DEAD/DEAH-box helicase domain-containing protein n=1 Tax=Symbiodinium microadriaticum TaxID=2951 RepID=A0A1Q9DBL6_SYMMI|nr:hypothetical protein AK812_SmicGene25613 [Symbiodinium microadriaticum]
MVSTAADGDSDDTQDDDDRQVCEKNTIVSMDTGLGKTLIAVMCIDFYLKRNPSKKVLMCVPTVQLAKQQATYIKETSTAAWQEPNAWKQSDELPRVLGLTASYLHGRSTDFQGRRQRLEATLRSQLWCADGLQADLQRHRSEQTFETLSYREAYTRDDSGPLWECRQDIERLNLENYRHATATEARRMEYTSHAGFYGWLALVKTKILPAVHDRLREKQEDRWRVAEAEAAWDALRPANSVAASGKLEKLVELLEEFQGEENVANRILVFVAQVDDAYALAVTINRYLGKPVATGASTGELSQASSEQVAAVASGLPSSQRDKVQEALRMMAPRLRHEDGELSSYFARGYGDGECFQGQRYTEDVVSGIPTYRSDTADGPVHVWRHAFDLRGLGDGVCKDPLTLYHYTNGLCFRNVGNMTQSSSELFASLLDERAHFGKGLYASQHEPAVWNSRTRILLNNYSNGDPLRDSLDAEGAERVREWGDENRCTFSLFFRPT